MLAESFAPKLHQNGCRWAAQLDKDSAWLFPLQERCVEVKDLDMIECHIEGNWLIYNREVAVLYFISGETKTHCNTHDYEPLRACEMADKYV